MCATLLLRLSGPMQSWGTTSHFAYRGTMLEPSKSGVIGMIAAALGRERGERIDDLSALEFGVRIDQPGQLICDFQTEIPAGSKESLPLSYRYYLSDAKFLVALSGDDALIDSIDHALRDPVWTLYLGRRSCPPDSPVSMGLHGYLDVRDALTHEAWIAAPWYKHAFASKIHSLEIRCDARDDDSTAVLQDDIPISFSQKRRLYATRHVVSYRVPLANL